MAKEGILIDRYEGGVNNKDSQKDLPNGFLAEAKNIDVSEIGRHIKLSTWTRVVFIQN